MLRRSATRAFNLRPMQTSIDNRDARRLLYTAKIKFDMLKIPETHRLCETPAASAIIRMKKSHAALVYLFITLFSITIANAESKQLLEARKLLASDGASLDFFGYSAAISKDTAIVGAYRADDARGKDVGAAYVYIKEGDEWVQQAKLSPSDGAEDDTFGGMVAIEGDTAVVGVIRKDHSQFGNDIGAVYVFVRSDGQWREQAKLIANDAAQGDSFGWGVSLSGNTLVVGAPRDDDNGENSGSVYVFERADTTWEQKAKLTANDGTPGDVFGISVSVSNNTIVVGADLNEENGVDAGAAYVFVRQGGQWAQQAKLLANDGAEGDIFGVRVVLDGDIVAISARRDDVESIGADAGSVYVFKRFGSRWEQQVKLVSPDGKADDRFGRSLSLAGDKLLIGAILEDSVGENTGAAYLFTERESNWEFDTKLTASDGNDHDVFGWAVAIDERSAFVTASSHDDNGENAGAGYVFTLKQ